MDAHALILEMPIASQLVLVPPPQADDTYPKHWANEHEPIIAPAAHH